MHSLDARGDFAAVTILGLATIIVFTIAWMHRCRTGHWPKELQSLWPALFWLPPLCLRLSQESALAKMILASILPTPYFALVFSYCARLVRLPDKSGELKSPIRQLAYNALFLAISFLIWKVYLAPILHGLSPAYLWSGIACGLILSSFVNKAAFKPQLSRSQ